MRISRLAISLTLVSLALSTYGQNAPHYSNFMFNKAVINPASIGSDNAIDITALYRNQWVGIEGNPTLQTLSIHSPLTVFNSNAGLYVLNEMQGAERATHIMLSYAYRHPFSFGSLSFGVSGGIIQKAIDGSKLRSPEGDYQSGIDHNDDFIPVKNESDIAPDLSLGAYFHTKRLYVGVSANGITQSKVQLDAPAGSSDIRFTRYYTFMGGYRFDINRKLNLQGNVLLNTDFVKAQTDINLLVQYNNNIYGGASFRGISGKTKDALAVLFGFKIVKNLRIGYSYDFSLSALNNVNSGSHEIYLRYQLSIKELLSPGKIIYNPRFL